MLLWGTGVKGEFAIPPLHFPLFLHPSLLFSVAQLAFMECRQYGWLQDCSGPSNLPFLLTAPLHHTSLKPALGQKEKMLIPALTQTQ